MKTRGIIGRTIVAIEQDRVAETMSWRGTHMDVIAIVLDNGVSLKPYTIETDTGDYDHDFYVRKAKP